MRIEQKWIRVNEAKCEFDGPFECSNCGGHIMIDATYIEQVDDLVRCPYCENNNEIPE